MAVETGWLPAGGMHAPGCRSSAASVRHLAASGDSRGACWFWACCRCWFATYARRWPIAWTRRSRWPRAPTEFRRRRLLFRHLLPAALNPLVSLFGFSLGTLLSASLLVEVLVGWPGLGPLFLEAIMARDFALVLGVVMSLGHAC